MVLLGYFRIPTNCLIIADLNTKLSPENQSMVPRPVIGQLKPILLYQLPIQFVTGVKEGVF